jgi:hypothetical protein
MHSQHLRPDQIIGGQHPSPQVGPARGANLRGQANECIAASDVGEPSAFILSLRTVVVVVFVFALGGTRTIICAEQFVSESAS